MPTARIPYAYPAVAALQQGFTRMSMVIGRCSICSMKIYGACAGDRDRGGMNVMAALILGGVPLSGGMTAKILNALFSHGSHAIIFVSILFCLIADHVPYLLKDVKRSFLLKRRKIYGIESFGERK